MSQNIDRDAVMLVLVKRETKGCALTRIGNALGISGCGSPVWKQTRRRLGLSFGEYHGIMNGWDRSESPGRPYYFFDAVPMMKDGKHAADFYRGQELGKRLWQAVHG